MKISAATPGATRYLVAVIWRVLVLLAAAVVAVALARPRAAERSAPAPVGWLPAAPEQGDILVVSVGPDTGRTADTVAEVEGAIAGQPLHFERGVSGVFRAIGAIPAGSPGSTVLTLRIQRRNGTEDRFIRVPVLAGDFDTIKLRMAPQYVDRPDSALQLRLLEEAARQRAGLAGIHTIPRLWRAPLVRPVSGRVTERYGTVRELNGWRMSQHSGLDLRGATGTPVHAAARGVVALAEPFYYTGNAVYLEHGAGLVTAYFHLSRILVVPGDTVEPGDVIGEVGATGRVTGPHLHFEVRYGRVRVNPVKVLELDSTAARLANLR